MKNKVDRESDPTMRNKSYGFLEAGDVFEDYSHTFFSRDKYLRPISSRIDLILFEGFLSSSLNSYKVVDTGISDHHGLYAAFNITKKNIKHKRSWKLNSDLLNDPIVNSKIINIIEKAKSNFKNGNYIFIEIEKMIQKVRGTCRSAGAKKAEEKRKLIYEIQNIHEENIQNKKSSL
ncbi:Uncharacterized protein FKW44_014538, partial [Caligus rogercresseyi]